MVTSTSCNTVQLGGGIFLLSFTFWSLYAKRIIVLKIQLLPFLLNFMSSTMDGASPFEFLVKTNLH